MTPGEILKIKAAVRLRDGMRCVKCGMTDAQHRAEYGTTLQTHRKIPGSEYTLDGCETVCQACHGKLPKRPASGIKRALRPGKIPLYVEIPVDMDADLRALAKRSGRNFRQEFCLALRRHLAYPPISEK